VPLLRPRAVRSDRPGAGRIQVTAGREDSLLTTIINYIPIDVLAVYKFVIGVIPSDADAFRVGSTILAIVLTPLWIVFATTPEGGSIALRQVIIAPVAFVFYAAAIQGDVVRVVVPSWQPWMGSASLAFGTLILVILEGILKRLGVPQALRTQSLADDASRTVSGPDRRPSN
jgi:hypothetical protein